jgi:hypothetical protein
MKSQTKKALNKNLQLLKYNLQRSKMLTINRNALLSKELRELAHREYVSSRA